MEIEQSMFLTDAEIERLTSKKAHSAQKRALSRMGIEHKQRPDGSIVVSRKHVEKMLGETGVSGSAGKEIEPNWNGVK